jgi:hypothetical protein
MLSRPTAVALAILALAVAPAALAKETVTIDSGLMARLQVAYAVPATAVARKDHVRSCQVGASRSRIKLAGASSAGETERKASTVACEQPPRSNLNLSGGLKGAEASAIAAAG